MTSFFPGKFSVEPSLDHPGWLSFGNDAPQSYVSSVLGEVLLRQESERTCRMRIETQSHLSNLYGAVHGGALLGMMDVSLFAGMALLTSARSSDGVTVDLASQFMNAGRMGRPLDAVVELLRETGRMVFLRGLVEQDGVVLASYSGTVRKTPQTA